MNKKPGFQGKINGESLVFIIIGIVIFAFIFLMPNIYKLMSELKTGNLFKKEDAPVENNNVQNDEIENEIEEPNGETSLVCTRTTSDADGNLEETYTFYYNNDTLESIKNQKIYDAITDEYLNYVYSEQAKFNKMGEDYKDIEGFKYDSVVDSRTLTATFVYDLTKLNLYEFNNDELNIEPEQSLDSIKESYINMGYACR